MLDLSNLSTEIRILLIVVVGGDMGAVNHKFNPNQQHKMFFME